MKSDRKIYAAFTMVFLLAGILALVPSAYSALCTEKKAETLLSDAQSTAEFDSGKLTEAYILLRNPGIFAGYENFDSEGIAVKNTLRYMDSKIFTGSPIKESDGVYVKLLLERRGAGSNLGIKSAVFSFILSILGFSAMKLERKHDS